MPFPVEPRYSVRPTLQRWSAGDRGHLRLDARYPAYLGEKLRLLSDDAPGCRVPAARVGEDVLMDALQRAAEGLARDAALHPPAGPGVPAPIVADDGHIGLPLLGVSLERGTARLRLERPEVRVPGLDEALLERVGAHLEGLRPVERLADALALAVQEDLALVRGTAPDGASDGTAELLHVCFPSSWDPGERAGAGFVALHAPIPDNGALLGAAARVVQAMVDKGPFVRYVWSLSPDGALDRNPRRVPRASGRLEPAALWFRTERQTVMPMPEAGRALFTIRVYRAPLPSVLTSPERRSALAGALASMSEALLEYKGVGTDRAAWIAYLESA